MEEYKDELDYALRDVFRLGACLGSWVNSDQKWHNRVAHNCMGMVVDAAIDEIHSQIRHTKYTAAKKYLQVD